MYMIGWCGHHINNKLLQNFLHFTMVTILDFMNIFICYISCTYHSWFTFTYFNLTSLLTLSPHRPMCNMIILDISSRFPSFTWSFFYTSARPLFVEFCTPILRNVLASFVWNSKEKQCYSPDPVVFLIIYLEAKNLLPLNLLCGRISYDTILYFLVQWGEVQVAVDFFVITPDLKTFHYYNRFCSTIYRGKYHHTIVILLHNMNF